MEKTKQPRCPFCLQTVTVRVIGDRPIDCLCGAEWVETDPRPNVIAVITSARDTNETNYQEQLATVEGFLRMALEQKGGERITDAVSLFQYWPNGNESVNVNPDPPEPDEAIPFHIVIRSSGWIPVSILVFARDKDHALSRVRQALVTCRDKDYTSQHSDKRKGRAQQYLDALDGKGLDNGGKPMWVEVRALDIGLICAEVTWAANGDLL